MALGILTRIVLQTDLGCVAGVSLIGVVPAASWSVTERIDGFLVYQEATVTVPITWEWQSSLLARRVLRFWYLDGSTAGWEEFRINRIRRNLKTGLITLSCRSPVFDLTDSGTLVTDADYGVSLTTILTNRAIPALPSHWSLGTVTPSTTIDGSYAAATPMAIALAGIESIYNATGSRYELSARANGSTGYYLDVTAYNASAAVADVRTRKNVVDATLTYEDTDQATRLYTATPGAFARPHYEISTISAGAYIEVIDLTGGMGPAREDDQWNTTYYWYEMKNGTSHQITDTVKVSATVTRFLMASTAGMAVGEWGYIAADSSNTDLSKVDSPSLQATWGIKTLSLSGLGTAYTNRLKNPDLRSDTAGVPTSWTNGGGGFTLTRTTTSGLWKTGGASYRIQQGAVAAGSLTQSRTVQCAAGEYVLYGAWIYVTAWGGVGRTPLIRFTDPNATTDVTYKLDGTDTTITALNTWYFVTAQFTVQAAGAKTITVTVSETGAGADTLSCYFDGANAIVAPAGSSNLSQTILVGSGAALNVAAANNYFGQKGTPIPIYETDLVDLYALDPVAWANDPLRVGATLNLTDDTLGLTTTALRVMSLERTSDRPANPRVTLSTIPKKISTTLANASASGGTTTVVVGGSSGGGGGGYTTVQDEGVALTARTTMNFVGAGVTAADSGGVTTVTIPGGSGSGNSVTVTVDFGAGFTDKAQTVVTGQAWVASGSEIIAQVLVPAGVDPDELRLLDLKVVISDLVVGTGFTVTAYSEAEAKGTYDIMCVGV